jgi:hypothetical protein
MIVVVPLVFYVAALAKEGSYEPLFPFPSILTYLVALLLMAIKGPIEELAGVDWHCHCCSDV